jgi:hypothetical protein
MVGITIQNEVNQNDKPIGISFRYKDQVSEDVIWSVFEKVTQSNSRFTARDRLVMTVHSVKITVGFGLVKAKGRPVSVLAHLKRSIVEVKAENNCLAKALLIAISRKKQRSELREISQRVQDTSRGPKSACKDRYQSGSRGRDQRTRAVPGPIKKIWNHCLFA